MIFSGRLFLLAVFCLISLQSVLAGRRNKRCSRKNPRPFLNATHNFDASISAALDVTLSVSDGLNLFAENTFAHIEVFIENLYLDKDMQGEAARTDYIFQLRSLSDKAVRIRSYWLYFKNSLEALSTHGEPHQLLFEVLASIYQLIESQQQALIGWEQSDVHQNALQSDQTAWHIMSAQISLMEKFLWWQEVGHEDIGNEEFSVWFRRLFESLARRLRRQVKIGNAAYITATIETLKAYTGLMHDYEVLRDNYRDIPVDDVKERLEAVWKLRNETEILLGIRQNLVEVTHKIASMDLSSRRASQSLKEIGSLIAEMVDSTTWNTASDEAILKLRFLDNLKASVDLYQLLRPLVSDPQEFERYIQDIRMSDETVKVAQEALGKVYKETIVEKISDIYKDEWIKWALVKEADEAHWNHNVVWNSFKLFEHRFMERIAPLMNVTIPRKSTDTSEITECSPQDTSHVVEPTPTIELKVVKPTKLATAVTITSEVIDQRFECNDLPSLRRSGRFIYTDTDLFQTDKPIILSHDHMSILCRLFRSPKTVLNESWKSIVGLITVGLHGTIRPSGGSVNTVHVPMKHSRAVRLDRPHPENKIGLGLAYSLRKILSSSGLELANFRYKGYVAPFN